MAKARIEFKYDVDDDAGTVEEEIKGLSMVNALIEVECAKLRGSIGEEQLPRKTQNQRPERMQIQVKGEVDAFEEVQSVESVFGGTRSSLVVLHRNNVVSPKKFQKVSWPVLRQNFNTLLLAPQGAGKFMSTLPIVAGHAPSSRVIVASNRRRCLEYYNALLNVPRMSPLVLETPRSKLLDINVILCSFAALTKVARSEDSFVMVLDGLDKLAEQGCTMQTASILDVLAEKASRVIATTRTFSKATMELARGIGFQVLVEMNENTVSTGKHCRNRIMICEKNARYGVLKHCLEQRNESEDVALILVKNKTGTNHLENKLMEDDVYAQSLHAEDFAEQELAQDSLAAGQPGVYIVTPNDLSWLQDIGKVDLLVDLMSARSPSAFSMREGRVKSSGTFVSFLQSSHTQTASWIITMCRHREADFPAELHQMSAAHDTMKRKLLEYL